MSGSTLKIAVVAGEESGDVLGADLIEALKGQTSASVELIGIGGSRLQGLGMKSLFDSHEIALFGISSVIRNLPSLLRRIGMVSNHIIAEKPDCLVIIDSPDFTHRVARRVRARMPELPIVNYVCPSVWAWRAGRANAMCAYVDEVLALLPFEPDFLADIKGPASTYVGHPLNRDPFITQAQGAQQDRELDRFSDWRRPVRLLCLPGSRRGEIDRHMDAIGKTLSILSKRGRKFEILLHTLPHHEARVRHLAANWPMAPRISTDGDGKMYAFAHADAALAASGTVTLELALAGVPFVSIYKLDPLARILSPLVRIWSFSLPNLVTDQLVVPEYINSMVRPGLLARAIEALARPGPARDAQLQGFELVRERLATERPAGDLAAERVLSHIKNTNAKSDS